ncbi:hypothetical protein [Arthrobacter sp. ISL-72]|nr:hypothetical protein [Arthrobacter sp. ISL-72]
MGDVERPRLYRTLRSFLAAADQDSDGFVVVPAPEHIVDERDASTKT